jgi:hypothetical protein
MKAFKFPSSLHLSEGIFTPTPHSTPTLRPSTPFLLAQHPHIRILTSLLHPHPKPLHALTRVFQGALLSSDEAVFVFSFSHCREVRPAGFGAGHPGNFHGSIALAVDMLVFAVVSVVMLLLLLLLLLLLSS